MYNCIPPQRDWIDILAALLTPTIAILGSYIALRQWLTGKNKLKLDLFEKRYTVFEGIKKFIVTILSARKIKQENTIEYLRDTKSVSFLFDDEIAKLTEEIYKKAIRLDTLIKTEEGLNKEQLEQNLNKQDEIVLWFTDQLKNIDDLFKKYLKLQH